MGTLCTMTIEKPGMNSSRLDSILEFSSRLFIAKLLLELKEQLGTETLTIWPSSHTSHPTTRLCVRSALHSLAQELQS